MPVREEAPHRSSLDINTNIETLIDAGYSALTRQKNEMQTRTTNPANVRIPIQATRAISPELRRGVTGTSIEQLFIRTRPMTKSYKSKSWHKRNQQQQPLTPCEQANELDVEKARRFGMAIDQNLRAESGTLHTPYESSICAVIAPRQSTRWRESGESTVALVKPTS